MTFGGKRILMKVQLLYIFNFNFFTGENPSISMTSLDPVSPRARDMLNTRESLTVDG